MNVDDVVQQRIAAARARITATKARRAALQEARTAGLVARHRAKLAYLDQENTVQTVIGRQKGGAPQLGARRPGEQGPFGPYGSGGGLEDEQPPDDGQPADA